MLQFLIITFAFYTSFNLFRNKARFIDRLRSDNTTVTATLFLAALETVIMLVTIAVFWSDKPWLLLFGFIIAIWATAFDILLEETRIKSDTIITKNKGSNNKND